MGKRHTARRLVLQALYASAIQNVPSASFVDRMGKEIGASIEGIAFAVELTQFVDAHLMEIDREIQQNLQLWTYERVALVDKCVLRMALGEIKRGGVPPEVTIDEAVELAREYGGEESPDFVNGLLGAVFRGGYNHPKVQ